MRIERFEPVVVGDVEEMVVGETRIGGEAEHAHLVAQGYVDGERGHGQEIPLRIDHAHAAGAFREDESTIGQESDRPGNTQIFGDNF